MATTFIHPLKDASSSLIYTELGNGQKKKKHEAEGTTRAACEMGDLPRDDMAKYAKTLRESHPGRKTEAYEIRVSFSPDELKAHNADDEQMALTHSYKLCKKIYPNSMCYVTVHNDGKGECVHAHCLVVNHDEVTGKTLQDNLRHFEVKNASDELAAEEGMTVVGTPKFYKDKHPEGTTWEKRREECDVFEQRLGDKVQHARDTSENLDEFKEHLKWSHVELREKVKVDDDGVEHSSWSYHMMDEWGPKRRKRRRKAKDLVDDLSKEGIESYYAEKALESPNKSVEDVKPNVESVEQEKPSEGEYEPLKAHIEDEATYSLLDDYKVDSEDVRDFTDALASQYRRKAIHEGRDLRRDADYAQIRLAQKTSIETTEKLQADVDVARAQFRADKAAMDELKYQKAPNLYGLRQCFKLAGQQKGKSQFERMLDDMFAQMMAELVRQMVEEQQRQAREEAEKRLYESRKDMWNAEKRLKAANRAIDHEMSHGGRAVSAGVQETYDRAVEQMKQEDAEQFGD
ncbi:TPA: relaxase [Streptococcus agalactiae]